jgi:hypothetical protein
MGKREIKLGVIALAVFVLPKLLWAADAGSDWQRLVAAAKRKGKSSSARRRAATLKMKCKPC